jgi:hypothetical protein
LKFEHFSLKIRRCDFSLNELRSRFATLFSGLRRHDLLIAYGGFRRNLKKIESDGTAGGV